MRNYFQLENQLGVYHTKGDPVYDLQRNRILFPVGNMIKSMDVFEHKTNLLPFETSYSIQMIRIDPASEILFVSDDQNYLYMFNLSNGRLIGKKRFPQKISGIHFNTKNSLIFVISGRYVFMYERPAQIDTLLFEPFSLVKKYNSKSEQTIDYFKFGPEDLSMFLATDDSVLRL